VFLATSRRLQHGAAVFPPSPHVRTSIKVLMPKPRYSPRTPSCRSVWMRVEVGVAYREWRDCAWYRVLTTLAGCWMARMMANTAGLKRKNFRLSRSLHSRDRYACASDGASTANSSMLSTGAACDRDGHPRAVVSVACPPRREICPIRQRRSFRSRARHVTTVGHSACPGPRADASNSRPFASKPPRNAHPSVLAPADARGRTTERCSQDVPRCGVGSAKKMSECFAAGTGVTKPRALDPSRPLRACPRWRCSEGSVTSIGIDSSLLARRATVRAFSIAACTVPPCR